MSSPREALLVFLRVPEPGRAKTRLIPALGPEGAVRVYERVARHVLEQGGRVQRPSLERLAFVAPDGGAQELTAWGEGAFEMLPQGSGDLGERMSAAFERAFARGAERAVIIGTDCPDVDAALLGRAFDALDEHDAVLGPALDGGYYLLGLRGRRPEAFRDVPWSSPDTLSRTRDRLRQSGARWTELERLRDLDDPDDLEALRPRFPHLL